MSSNTASKTPASSSTISSSHTDSPPTKRIALESIQTSSKQEPISNSNAKDVSSSNGATPAPQSTSMDVNLKTDSTSSSAPYTPGGVTFSADKTSAGITSSSGAEPVASTSSSIAVASSSSANTANNQNVVSDVLEERLIDAEYKIWKKNTPYLYDLVMTHSLEWPSLTCQWLPTIKSNEDDKAGGITGAVANSGSEVHELLLGTHTTEGDQNYLMVGTVNLPKSDGVVDLREPKDQDSNGIAMIPPAAYDEEKREVGGFGYQTSTPQQSSNNSNSNNQDGQKQNPSSTLATNLDGKIDIRMKILHEGEINRARYMPQNHFMVATKGPSPLVYVFDLCKHPSYPTAESTFAPQFTLSGHEREGYGLCWNPHETMQLISGGEDGLVCYWDLNAKLQGEKLTLDAASIFRGHTDVVEDVDWHKRDVHLIGSCGDDRTVRLWDVREVNPNKATKTVVDAHDADINSLAFNPVNEFLLVTGSADKTCALWDLRNLKQRLQTLVGHTDQVFRVEWSPFNESVLGSCGADRRTNVWDLSRIGMEQTSEDADDGPPELLFMHGGHTSKVSDFSWNRNDEWTIASVSEDNVLQVWNMAEEIYMLDEDMEAKNDEVDEIEMKKEMDLDDAIMGE